MELIQGLIVGAVTAFLSWRVNLVAMHQGLSNGRRAAFLLGFGATLGDLLYMNLALFGIEPLFQNVQFRAAMKWIGVATLLLISWGLFTFQVKNAQEKVQQKIAAGTHPKSLLLGFFMILGTPALLVAWIGMIGFLVSFFNLEIHGAWSRILFSIGMVWGASLWFFLFALVIIPRFSDWSRQHIGKVSKGLAIVLALSAILLIFERF